MMGGMKRPALHNCYLPDWMHRCANGAIGGMAGIAVATLAMRFLSAPTAVLWLGVISIVAGAALNPQRFTLVEGCAGDVGYDELDGDA